jgi:benzoyl-CoA reductase/2-hydroxyglutaryl-CoA dehydratase subunit BcrC/BadD/HgdB
MLRISKDVLENTMRKQTNNTKKTWALLHTTGCKDSPGIVFDAEIVADIITRNSERKDIWQDKMLDITMRKQTETTQKSRILLQALLLVTHIYSTTLSEK